MQWEEAEVRLLRTLRHLKTVIYMGKQWGERTERESSREGACPQKA